MHEGNRTEISTLGEFGLIKHLTDNIKLVNNGHYRLADGRCTFRFGIYTVETSGI